VPHTYLTKGALIKELCNRKRRKASSSAEKISILSDDGEDGEDSEEEDLDAAEIPKRRRAGTPCSAEGAVRANNNNERP
jgi:hypothetical protein